MDSQFFNIGAVKAIIKDFSKLVKSTENIASELKTSNELKKKELDTQSLLLEIEQERLMHDELDANVKEE